MFIGAVGTSCIAAASMSSFAPAKFTEARGWFSPTEDSCSTPLWRVGLGGAILGGGMAVGGACPGMVLAQVRLLLLLLLLTVVLVPLLVLALLLVIPLPCSHGSCLRSAPLRWAAACRPLPSPCWAAWRARWASASSRLFSSSTRGSSSRPRQAFEFLR